MNKQQILKECQRWLLNGRESSLHQRISNREIMAVTHTYCLSTQEGIPDWERLSRITAHYTRKKHGNLRHLCVTQIRQGNNKRNFQRGLLTEFNQAITNPYTK